MRDTWLETLRWYVSAHGRMGLGAFNWILFFIFLPTLLVQIYAVYHFMGEAVDMTQQLSGVLGGGNVQSAMNAVQGMLNGQEEVVGSAGERFWKFVVLPLLPYITYACMIPAVIMRLRDIGWDTRWATIIAFGAGLGMAKHVFNLDVPAFPRMLLFCVEFYILTMLTIKKSVPVQRHKFEENEYDSEI